MIKIKEMSPLRVFHVHQEFKSPLDSMGRRTRYSKSVFNTSSALDVDLFQTLMRLNKTALEELLTQVNDDANESCRLKSIVQGSKYGCLELACHYIKGILRYLSGFIQDISARVLVELGNSCSSFDMDK
jgi:hypothetical protein